MDKQPSDVEVQVEQGTSKLGLKFTGAQAWAGVFIVSVVIGLVAHYYGVI